MGRFVSSGAAVLLPTRIATSFDGVAAHGSRPRRASVSRPRRRRCPGEIFRQEGTQRISVTFANQNGGYL